jgi:hypothetical protein
VPLAWSCGLTPAATRGIDSKGSAVKTLTRKVARGILAGDDLDSINDEVIAPRVNLSEDQRAAAWLYGWSLQAPQVQRATVRRMLDTM